MILSLAFHDQTLAFIFRCVGNFGIIVWKSSCHACLPHLYPFPKEIKFFSHSRSSTVFQNFPKLKHFCSLVNTIILVHEDFQTLSNWHQFLTHVVFVAFSPTGNEFLSAHQNWLSWWNQIENWKKYILKQTIKKDRFILKVCLVWDICAAHTWLLLKFSSNDGTKNIAASVAALSDEWLKNGRVELFRKNIGTIRCNGARFLHSKYNFIQKLENRKALFYNSRVFFSAILLKQSKI